MTLQNQIKIWAIILVVLILAVWIFRGILLPFIAGMILAYLLNPIVTFLQKLKIGRGWGSAIVLIFALVIVTWAFFLMVPAVVGQIIGLAERLPGYVSVLQSRANDLMPAISERFGPVPTQQLERWLTDALGNIVGWTASITGMLAQSGVSILGTLGLVIITPVVAFYLLLDWDSMVEGLDDLLPRAYRDEIRGILGEIDHSMAGVIRGQGSVVLILTVYYTTTLSLAGLNFGLAVGLIAGLFSFVPYVGFFTGFILSMGIALVQFSPNWLMVAVIFAIYILGQFIEGNVLYPKLVGSSLGINPVWLMFSLFAFALLFGFVGVLLAVPLSAIAAVLIRFMIRKYKESSLYRGDNGDNNDARQA